MRIWIDITAPAHVLVFRPLIALMRERGDEVEVTARDYAGVGELLRLHDIEAQPIGRHGGASSLGKLAAMVDRLPTLVRVPHRAEATRDSSRDALRRQADWRRVRAKMLIAE